MGEIFGQYLEKREIGVVDNKCWEMRESLEEGSKGREEETGSMDGRIFIEFCNFSVFTDKNGPSTISAFCNFNKALIYLQLVLQYYLVVYLSLVDCVYCFEPKLIFPTKCQ